VGGGKEIVEDEAMTAITEEWERMEGFHGTELRRNGNLAMGIDRISLKTEVFIMLISSPYVRTLGHIIEASIKLYFTLIVRNVHNFDQALKGKFISVFCQVTN